MIRFFHREKCHLHRRKKSYQAVKHANFEHTYVLASLNLLTANRCFLQVFQFAKFKLGIHLNTSQSNLIRETWAQKARR